MHEPGTPEAETGGSLEFRGENLYIQSIQNSPCHTEHTDQIE